MLVARLKERERWECSLSSQSKQDFVHLLDFKMRLSALPQVPRMILWRFSMISERGESILTSWIRITAPHSSGIPGLLCLCFSSIQFLTHGVFMEMTLKIADVCLWDQKDFFPWGLHPSRAVLAPGEAHGIINSQNSRMG